jgi:hypothetical protein
MKNIVLIAGCAVISFASCGQTQNSNNMKTDNKIREVVKSDEEWKKELTPMQYEVTTHAVPNALLPVSIGITMIPVCIIVFVAVNRYSALIQNLIQAPAGPAFMHL